MADTQRVAHGSAMMPPVNRQDTELTATLRMISVYQPQTDQPLTRFDVLIGGKLVDGAKHYGSGMPGTQINAALISTAPGCGDMFVPEKGILGSFTFKAAPADLSAIFRQLADAIDNS